MKPKSRIKEVENHVLQKGFFLQKIRLHTACLKLQISFSNVSEENSRFMEQHKKKCLLRREGKFTSLGARQLASADHNHSISRSLFSFSMGLSTLVMYPTTCVKLINIIALPYVQKMLAP